MIIHMVCKYGECIPLKVMEGLLSAGCQPMVISSKSNNSDHGLDRENIYNNWKNAMSYSGNIFFGMDSDIVLRADSVDLLLEKLKRFHFAYFPTDLKNTHGLWAVSREVIENVPFKYYGDFCPVCKWKDDLIKSGYKNWRMGQLLETVQRLTKG